MIPSFHLFNFVRDGYGGSLFACENNGIDICSDRSLSELEYLDYIVLLSEYSSKMQDFLDRL